MVAGVFPAFLEGLGAELRGEIFEGFGDDFEVCFWGAKDVFLLDAFCDVGGEVA